VILSGARLYRDTPPETTDTFHCPEKEAGHHAAAALLPGWADACHAHRNSDAAPSLHAWLAARGSICLIDGMLASNNLHANQTTFVKIFGQSSSTRLGEKAVKQQTRLRTSILSSTNDSASECLNTHIFISSIQEVSTGILYTLWGDFQPGSSIGNAIMNPLIAV